MFFSLRRQNSLFLFAVTLVLDHYLLSRDPCCSDQTTQFLFSELLILGHLSQIKHNFQLSLLESIFQDLLVINMVILTDLWINLHYQLSLVKSTRQSSFLILEAILSLVVPYFQCLVQSYLQNLFITPKVILVNRCFDQINRHLHCQLSLFIVTSQIMFGILEVIIGFVVPDFQ